MRPHVLLFAALALLLSACGTTPNLDREFGHSMHLLQAQQIIDADAGRKRRPAANGLDGQAAAAAYDNYQRSFSTKEESSDNFTIGVGKR
jgi:hypothetical protein